MKAVCYISCSRAIRGLDVAFICIERLHKKRRESGRGMFKAEWWVLIYAVK